jgi:hypothetical protein
MYINIKKYHIFWFKIFIYFLIIPFQPIINEILIFYIVILFSIFNLEIILILFFKKDIIIKNCSK